MNVFLSTIFVYMAEKKLLKKSFFKRTVFLGSFFNLNAYNADCVYSINT